MINRIIPFLLFTGLAFWSCEEKQPTDCAGVEGGNAVLDNCNVCDDDPTNDCEMDCAGVWGGSAVVDSCGVCDDNPENDCIEDCAGVWGGSAVVDSCGVCDDNPENDCIEDCAGVWGGENICGCTDSTAANYDPEATFDDESCEYPVPLPMEFPLYENAGWIYNRYFYANEDDYDANIPEVVLQDTLFILTNVVEDGYYGFSWSSNAYYSLVKNYDNKFIVAGYHVFENDTTYFYDNPSIWASYDDVYDTNAINTDYASFPLNRSIVQDSLFENVYNAYKHDYDWYNSYVNSEGYSKFEINNVNDAFPSRVIMINKLNDMELQNALTKSETSRRQNNNVSNILDISRYPHSSGVNLNH